LLDLLLALLFPTLLLFARALNLFLTAILLFPALLTPLRTLDLLLSLLFPTLLAFSAVLLLLLNLLVVPAGFALLLTLDLLFAPASFALLLRLDLLFVPAGFALLLALRALGLVLLPPLFSAAASALSIREITCTHQRGGYRKRQPDLF